MLPNTEPPRHNTDEKGLSTTMVVLPKKKSNCKNSKVDRLTTLLTNAITAQILG